MVKIAPSAQTIRAVDALGSLVEEMDPRSRLALDADGNLLWASRGAEQALASLLAGEGTLPPALVAAACRLAALEAPLLSIELPPSECPWTSADLRLVHSPRGTFVAVTLESARDDLGPARLALRFGLSRAEAAVLDSLADGRSNSEIALRLRICVDTVKTHMRSVLRKLGVRTRLEAALAAREAS